MTDQIETPAAEKAPKRSQSRAALAARIQAREQAKGAFEASQLAGQQLQEHSRKAAALTAELDAKRAADAELLAQHALAGEIEMPALTDAARVQLHADLIEARSQAEAAEPAIQKVAANTVALSQAHHRASLAVHPYLQPVLEEEVAALAGEIKKREDELRPLKQRVVGLRNYIFSTAHSLGDDRGTPYFAFGSRLDALLKDMGVGSQFPSGDFQNQWSAFAVGLTTNPDLGRP